jgi:hypothetical protein
MWIGTSYDLVRRNPSRFRVSACTCSNLSSSLVEASSDLEQDFCRFIPFFGENIFLWFG